MKYQLLALCGAKDEALVRAGATQWARQHGQAFALECFRRREQLLYRLREGECDGVLVWLPGALGMESALGVRRIRKSLPLVWVSEDEVFALESYRLGVTAFLHAPVTAEQLAVALDRCLEPKRSASPADHSGYSHPLSPLQPQTEIGGRT